MKFNIKCNAKLLIGLFAVFLINVGLAVSNFYYTGKFKSLSAKLSISAQKMIAIEGMEWSANKRTIALVRMTVIEDPFERDIEFLKYRDLASDFLKYRGKFVSLGLSKEEAALLKIHSLAINKAVPQLNDLTEEVTDINREINAADVLNKVQKIQVDPLEAIENMIEHHLVNLHGLNKLNEEYYNLSTRMSVFWSGAGLVATLVLVLLLYRNTKIMTEDIESERNKALIQAKIDPLTGVLNRRGLGIELQEIFNNKRQEKNVLVAIDLDRFKIINDVCGHAGGDAALKKVVQIFKRGLRKNDLIGRMGGDEFTLLLRNCTTEQASNLMNSIRAEVAKETFVYESFNMNTTLSIGLRNFDKNIELKQLIKDADAACYVSKNDGKNQITAFKFQDKKIFDSGDTGITAYDVLNAIEKDKFILYEQSILNINNSLSPQRSYKEVLLRMENKAKDIVLPKDFLSIAENYGFMDKVDTWVIKAVFKHLHNLKYGGCGTKNLLFINLSGTSINNGKNLLEYIKEQLNIYNINPNKICFELTETAAIKNLSNATAFIKEIKDIGFKFALADFGTGMSTFTYLRNLPVDYLKIDGSFVKNLENDPINLVILHSVQLVCDEMNIKTIAERVEDEQNIDILKSINIDYIQGYAVAKPKPLQLCDYQKNEAAIN